jgi:hypothetical protein
MRRLVDVSSGRTRIPEDALYEPLQLAWEVCQLFTSQHRLRFRAKCHHSSLADSLFVRQIDDVTGY